MALLLTGSPRIAATSSGNSSVRLLTFEDSEVKVLASYAMALYQDQRYIEARAAFRNIAFRAQQTGNLRAESMNWNNAGACSMIEMQFGTAKADFAKAKSSAEAGHQDYALASTLIALASLYLQTGQPEIASRIAQEALQGPAGSASPFSTAILYYHLASAEIELRRFNDARPHYRRAIDGLVNTKNFVSAVRALAGFGRDFLRADRLADAEAALGEGRHLAHANHIPESSNLLSGLAQLRSRRGEYPAAEALFEAALTAPLSITPRYALYADRGQSRLNAGNLRGALDDFRKSRHLVTDMRADIVPADQDRVALETGLSRVNEGLVDAGNRLARQTGDRALLQETFDAAEQDRLWSLRALIPSPNDWRTRLPESYWELLVRYQALQRSAVTRTSPAIEKKTAALRLGLEQELEHMEARAAGKAAGENPESPLAHVTKILDNDTVLLSFHLSPASSWIWAVDRHHIDVFPLPPLREIQPAVEAFEKALRAGTPSTQLGAKLYSDLFGALPAPYLQHKRWLLELAGPLYELPFAALVTGEDARGPVYLIEHADLQSLPNSLLAERGGIPADGEFLGISDPVYNPADARYRGTRTVPELLLARLPNTSDEVIACAKAWNSPRTRILAGHDAQLDRFRTASAAKPAIIHFATHVISAPGDFRSGLIALSLNPAGEMGLLGPKEIVAHPVSAKLVVMDGCHSAQGDALPSAGLMGLTRAWIGAGAMAVLATRWDIPDDAAQSLMTDFYRALRASPQQGAAAALRVAQRAALRSPQARHSPATWAGYSLLSRML